MHLGTDAFFADTESSVVILSEGRRVTKFRLSDGYEEWAMDAPGVGDNILFKQLFVSDQSVHILAVTNSFASLTLTTMTLDLATSRPLDDFAQIPCILEAPENAHFAASDIPGSVKVLWLEVGRIKSTYIGPGGYVGNTKELLPRHGRFYERIITTGTRRAGLILGQSQNGEVTIIDVRDVAKPVTVWEGTVSPAMTCLTLGRLCREQSQRLLCRSHRERRGIFADLLVIQELCECVVDGADDSGASSRPCRCPSTATCYRAASPMLLIPPSMV